MNSRTKCLSAISFIIVCSPDFYFLLLRVLLGRRENKPQAFYAFDALSDRDSLSLLTLIRMTTNTWSRYSVSNENGFLYDTSLIIYHARTQLESNLELLSQTYLAFFIICAWAPEKCFKQWRKYSYKWPCDQLSEVGCNILLCTFVVFVSNRKRPICTWLVVLCTTKRTGRVLLLVWVKVSQALQIWNEVSGNRGFVTFCNDPFLGFFSWLFQYINLRGLSNCNSNGQPFLTKTLTIIFICIYQSMSCPKVFWMFLMRNKFY